MEEKEYPMETVNGLHFDTRIADDAFPTGAVLLIKGINDDGSEFFKMIRNEGMGRIEAYSLMLFAKELGHTILLEGYPHDYEEEDDD